MASIILTSKCNDAEYRIFNDICNSSNISIEQGILILIRKACNDGKLPLGFDYENIENLHKEKISDKDKENVWDIETFIGWVKSGSIKDYDGSGYISDGEYMYYEIICDASWLSQQPEKYTHVVWFNI